MVALNEPHRLENTRPAAKAAGLGTPSRLPPVPVLLFMLGVIIPVWFTVGPILLMPHRLILVLMFFPVLAKFLSGKAGPIRSFDILMALSAFWAVSAIFLGGSMRGNGLVQPSGIYVLESVGAYMMARVYIRTADDFVAFTKFFFLLVLVLSPLAMIESITHRAFLLEMIPNSVNVVNIPIRWGMRRAQSVFAHPILFGTFSGIGFGLFWYIMGSKLTRYGGALFAFMGTVFSLSSGALVSITFQIIFILWEKGLKQIPKRWTIFAVLFALTYITIDLLSNRTPFHVLVTYATFNSGSSYNRILIWRFGMENVWANPWFGLAENSFTWKRPRWMSTTVDNYWLLLAMKYGIPCVGLLAAALYQIIRRISFAQLRDPTSIACRAGYLTAIGGLILVGGTVHFWHGVMAFVMFFFGAGVWTIDEGIREQNRPEGEGADGEGDAVVEPSADDFVYTRQPARHSRSSPVPKTAPTRRTSRQRGG